MVAPVAPSAAEAEEEAGVWAAAEEENRGTPSWIHLATLPCVLTTWPRVCPWVTICHCLGMVVEEAAWRE